MTFKAVFLIFWPESVPGRGVPVGQWGGFGLQHTDFVLGS
jgi:hypothetical protein